MNKKYDLSYPQQNIWLVENFYDSKKINSISGSLKIYKEFDADIAKKTINKFVELNDAMRIKIEVCEDKVCQYILEYTDFDIPVQKIDMDNKKEVEKTKQEFLSKNISALDKRLFSYLILDGDKQGEIVLNVHHIISDAWSVSKMGEELAVIYDKIQKGETNFEKYPSYTEFIQKEDEYTKSDKFETDSIFWREYLKGFEEPIGLKEGEILNSLKAKRYETKLNKSLENKLSVYCKENRFSPYTVFMTALAIYMERVTEKQDIVIGTPVLNRSNFAEKNMQGMFVSTMPIRFKVDENDTFLDLCKKTAMDTMTLFRHQKYPYSKISEGYKEQTDNKDKLFKVMLSYQNARTEFEDKEKYEITWNFAGEIQDELEIHVSDLNNDGRLKIFYDYVDGLFENIEIKYLSKRIEEIIRDGIENNKTIETINIMPEEEKNKILYEFNNTKRPYPKDKTVIDLFEEQVEKTPNNIALVFEGKEMTYKELNEKANQVAWYLKEKGIKEHDMVAITLDKSIELMIAILAVLKVGACYVPIDTNYTEERKKYMLEDSECKLNIVEKEQDKQLIKQSLNIYDFEYNNKNIKNINRNNTYTWDSLVYVMYTSGTTGKPKGAMITNRNIVRLVKNTNYIKFKPDDRIIQTGATVFDACTFEYWGALLNGLRLYLIRKEEVLDPRRLKSFLKENKITIMWLTAPLFNQMIDIDPLIFGQLRVLLTGGDILSPKHINVILNKCNKVEVINGYGPTENTTFSNCFLIDKKYNKRIPIGRPIANSTGYIVDAKERILPIYVEGELYVGGDGVSKGYVNNEELTKQKYIKDKYSKHGLIYKTGDIVRWLSSGNIDFIGRRDNQVKIRGFRIELDEIKNAILKYGDVKDTVVIINENNNGNKEILGYFVSTKNEEKEKIYNYLKKILPSYMIPKNIMQLDNIPLNQNGKVDKGKLPLFEKNELISQKPFTYTQKIIYNKLNNISEMKIKDINTSIFVHGIDSINIIKLALELSNKFNVELSAADIFNNDTILKLDNLINNKKKKYVKSVVCNTVDSEFIQLNDGQLGIFGEYLKDPNSIKYNIPLEISVINNIEKERFLSSIEKVINIHKNIFMRIKVKEGKIFGVIKKEEFKLKFEKVTEINYKKIKKDYVKNFDLMVDRLFRINAYETEKNIYVLCDFYHMIFDGMSLNLLIKEIIMEYKGSENVNYSENNMVTNEFINNKDKAKIYFLNRFSGDLPNTILGENEDRKVNQNIAKNIKVNISKKTTNNLVKYSEKYKVSLNSIYQAVFCLALANILNLNDLIIGMAIVGRKNIENFNELGMFVKTYPYRTKIKDMNLNNYINNVQKDIIDIIDNSSYSFAELVKDLKIVRKSGYNPLFNIMFTYQYKDNSILKLNKNSTLKIENLYNKASKFDATFEIIDDRLSAQIMVEYNKYHINHEKIKSLIDEYIRCLKIITVKDDCKLSDMINLNCNNTSIKSEEKKNDFVNKFIISKEEKDIVEIYESVLNRKDILPNDNFFDIGGDSLLAIRIVSECLEKDYTVSYSDIFDYPTPRELAMKINSSNKKNRIDIDVNKYDYILIDELLNKKSSSKTNNKVIDKEKNILLTGATGFLGAHILDSYMQQYSGKIYCLVRKKNNKSAKIRLREKLNFFFGDKYEEQIGKRIKVIEGDIIYNNLKNDGKIKDNVIKDIDIVINSAAYVKHYGDKKIFYMVNVHGVENLVDFCVRYNKKLIHISTLSVSGNIIEEGQLKQDILKKTTFSENNLYFGQNLNNIYVYTKFLAERYILENILNRKLNAKIMRVGNLTGRFTDGKFQPNIEDNAFSNRIKTILNIEKVPLNIRNLYLEFTPIDMAADSIIKLLNSNQIIYHIFNHNHLSMSLAVKLLIKMGFKLKWVNKENMRNTVKDLIKNKKSMLLNGIIQDLNKEYDLEYSDNIIIKSDKTLLELNKYGFIWPEISEEYFKKYINYLIEVGFLGG